jgi:hypothetical protein
MLGSTADHPWRPGDRALVPALERCGHPWRPGEGIVILLFVIYFCDLYIIFGLLCDCCEFLFRFDFVMFVGVIRLFVYSTECYCVFFVGTTNCCGTAMLPGR